MRLKTWGKAKPREWLFLLTIESILAIVSLLHQDSKSSVNSLIFNVSISKLSEKRCKTNCNIIFIVISSIIIYVNKSLLKQLPSFLNIFLSQLFLGLFDLNLGFAFELIFHLLPLLSMQMQPLNFWTSKWWDYGEMLENSTFVDYHFPPFSLAIVNSLWFHLISFLNYFSFSAFSMKWRQKNAFQPRFHHIFFFSLLSWEWILNRLMCINMLITFYSMLQFLFENYFFVPFSILNHFD